MDKKQVTKVTFIALGLFLLWWLLQRNKQLDSIRDEEDLPPISIDPGTIVYGNNPDAFNPATLGNVNINIGNQGFGYLSNQYIPLFGFVGMAQGVLYD